MGAVFDGPAGRGDFHQQGGARHAAGTWWTDQGENMCVQDEI